MVAADRILILQFFNTFISHEKPLVQLKRYQSYFCFRMNSAYVALLHDMQYNKSAKEAAVYFMETCFLSLSSLSLKQLLLVQNKLYLPERLCFDLYCFSEK